MEQRPKIAVEVVLTLVACGALEPYQGVIQSGERGEGLIRLGRQREMPSDGLWGEPDHLLETEETVVLPENRGKKHNP